MRIKFEKGMTPERICEAFLNFVKENSLVIGAVNMYIQTYDDDMKPEKFRRGKEEEYLVCSPSDATQKKYAVDVARIRRKKMKVVG